MSKLKKMTVTTRYTNMTEKMLEDCAKRITRADGEAFSSNAMRELFTKGSVTVASTDPYSAAKKETTIIVGDQ